MNKALVVVLFAFPLCWAQPLELRILITGFGPFLNYTNNPSGEVALQLNGQKDHVPVGPGIPVAFDVVWDGIEIDVSHGGASKAAELIQQYPCRWDAVLHLGLEDFAKGLRLEVAAVNIMANTTPPLPIVKDGPTLLPTTGDLGRMQMKELNDKQEVWSRDAGTYFCNETLYRTLYVVRQLGTCLCTSSSCDAPTSRLLPVMFVHLPDPATTTVDVDVNLVRTIGWHLVSRM